MFCLGIESTAHTFGCSIVEFISLQDGNRGKILSDIRNQYRAPEGSGIHPREASRHHAQTASSVLKQSLEKAKTRMKEVDIIAYSAGPGLGPCLRVGAVIARALAAFYNKPLVPVNHALGHIELGAMITGASDPLVLLVSGGHTMLVAFSEKRWRVFGETLDITIGQLIDQFGRAIGFASPCGGRIEQLASQSSQNYLRLPYVVKGNDVSLSGLLTAAIKLTSEPRNALSDICYSMQETAFAMITESVERAISFTGKREVMIVGGVAANKRLVEMLGSASERLDAKLFSCPINFAGDNAVQIAWTGMLEYTTNKHGISIENSFTYQSWRLDTVEVRWRK
ncbi:MAG: KEOPS complex N(6)-L-threonylcarbamoyladenine synthase Kae1 [Nitrososphaeraceae archaeon]